MIDSKKTSQNDFEKLKKDLVEKLRDSESGFIFPIGTVGDPNGTSHQGYSNGIFDPNKNEVVYDKNRFDLDMDCVPRSLELWDRQLKYGNTEKYFKVYVKQPIMGKKEIDFLLIGGGEHITIMVLLLIKK